MAFSVPLVAAASEEEAVRLAYDAIAVDRMGLLSAVYVDIDTLRENWLILTNRDYNEGRKIYGATLEFAITNLSCPPNPLPSNAYSASVSWCFL